MQKYCYKNQKANKPVFSCLRSFLQCIVIYYNLIALNLVIYTFLFLLRNIIYIIHNNNPRIYFT